jgi:hypothetical protein
MDLTVSTDERFDGLDREQFREMVESKAFRLFLVRVTREYSRTLQDAARLDEPRDIYRAQGAAMMTEAILKLPARILDEMKPKPAKKR